MLVVGVQMHDATCRIFFEIRFMDVIKYSVRV